MFRKNILKLLEQVKDLEEQLIQKDRENKKFIDRFVANISHEIRTPLNAIVGFSGLLKTRELTDAKKEQYITHISDSSERLLHLIDNIMELSYYQSNSMKLKIEECNISEILKSALYYVNHIKEKNNKEAVAIVCNDAMLEEENCFYSDCFRILLVLRNLLNNALKYTEQGLIEFGCYIKNNMLEFYVKDSGTGIRNNNPLIFDSFYKDEPNYLTGKEGLGIGLSVSKGIIENLKGQIWFSTNNFNGTTFFFTVPYITTKTNVSRKKETSILIN